MKVFYWGRVYALAECFPGEVIAVAESKEEAIALVMDKFRLRYTGPGWENHTRSRNEIKEEEKFEKELSSTEPEEIELPAGFYIYGSQ
jgi:hypothetical protein